jgi:hypothetical protein
VAAIFPRAANLLIPALLVVIPPGGIAAGAVAWYYAMPEFTDVGYEPDQPVPYSHKLHAGELGIDCRYCHNTVERGHRAAVPPNETCMNCHKVIKTDSELLAPIRTAAESPDDPVEWSRVHLLPDFVYFDHGVHMAAAVGCVDCHGRIDQMVTVHQAKPMSMAWCLRCHRDPEPNLRPRDKVTDMTWTQEDHPEFDPTARDRAVSPPEHCSGCHR